MPKKKKKKKKTPAAQPPAAAAPASPCDRGPEIKGLELTIHVTDPLALFFQACAGVGQLSCFLGNVATTEQHLIGEAGGVTDKGVVIPVPTSSMAPGRYVLSWTFRVDANEADEWTTAHELQMNQAVLFRLYKHKASSRPTNTLFMFLVALP